MSDKTGIEWCDATWNPTKGCDRVSPGCDHCYAMTMAKRLRAMGSPGYQLDGDPRTSGPGFLAHEWPKALDWPLGEKKPLRIFVDSMADLFHDNISDDYIAQVWAVMSMAPQHTFQVLTKRHARMRALTRSALFRLMVNAARMRRGVSVLPDSRRPDGTYAWPLSNVWLGVSVETQQWADIRIPALLDTPAAVRFVSCEPLLSPVQLSQWLTRLHACDKCEGTGSVAVLGGGKQCPVCLFDARGGQPFGVDWVIVGGESGHGARPMDAVWARSIRDQCVTADVAFLFKQWGSHDEHGQPMSKHAAGRTLDGRTWDQYPAMAHA